jgi:hypothetical protein
MHLPPKGRDLASLAHPVVAGSLLSVAALSIGLSGKVVAKTSAPSLTVGSETTAAAQPSDERTSMDTHFELHILDESSVQLRLGYDFQPAWTVLKRAYRSRIAFTITEREVETYEWSRQVITLRPGPSEELVAKLARNDEERRHPEAALDLRGFVVVLDGHPVYGGIFMQPLSAMGIDFPVTYARLADSRLVLSLRPGHEVSGDYASYEPLWHGIKDPRIRDVFAEAGRLVP